MMSNDLISGVFVASASNSMRLETHVGLDLRHRNCGSQVSRSRQIVGGTGQGKDPMQFAHAVMPNLSHQRDRLQPAEAFFDPLPLLLADGVARVPRGAVIHGAAPASRKVLCHVRRHPQMAAPLHESECVEPFVAADRQRCVPGSFSSMISAASRSAVPFAWKTSASTISPLWFSTNRFPL
jgi:hypothetical protein